MGSLETATILLVLACICVGVVAAVVTTWRLRSVLYSLEDRTSLLEGIVNREVKVRAAQTRVPKAGQEELLKQLVGSAALVMPKKANWWEKVNP